METKNMETKENIKENNKQSNLLVEKIFIKNYSEYVKYLVSNNWIRERITLNEYLASIVTTNNLNANNEGSVLDIVCPPGMIVSIMGIKDANYPDECKIENIRPFELKLANSNGEEIDPDTIIKIIKKKILGKEVEIYEVQYKDVSMTNYSSSRNMFKAYNELYRLEQGIQLKGEDHLRLHVVNPNIDINIIKFGLGIDLWSQIE